MNRAYSYMRIFYFSGTGNSKHVAHWIGKEAKQLQIPYEIINIAVINRKNIYVGNDELIGLISPTHGFNFPPIMFHFLFRLPYNKNNSIFIVNTRAGMKMGKYFLPGLSGMTQYFSAILLRLKGYGIKAMFPVDLPSNWISLHPGLKDKVIESIYDKREKEVKAFARKLLCGKKNFKALKDITQDILITPIAFLYYLFGRFFLAKTFYASKACNNCNLCIKQCPVQAIKIINKRPFWTYKCESCMKCMNTCPQRAIETAHGFITGILFLTNSLVLFYFYRLVNIDEYILNNLSLWFGKLLITFINTIFILLTLFTSYRLMHSLLKYSVFEKIIVYTSLTKFKFWRRYKFKKLNKKSNINRKIQ